jgi:hypothetical protein
MDDILATLVFACVIGAQFLVVIAARRAQQYAPQETHHATNPDAVRVQHIWLFG